MRNKPLLTGAILVFFVSLAWGAAQQETPADSAPVTARWFSNVSFWNPPTTWTTDATTVQGVITEKTGLIFEMDIPPQDADAKLSLSLVSGNMPDVMTITNDVLIKQLVDSGNVWKIDELMKKYDPQSHLLTQFPADIKQRIVTRDGGWYAYPSHMNSEDARKIYPPSSDYYEDFIKYRSNGAIMFNTSIMKQAGLALDDLHTETDILAAFEKVSKMGLKVDGAAVIPLLLDGKVYQDASLGVIHNMFGTMPVDASGKYRDPMLSPQYKDALEFLWTVVNRGYVDPNQFTLDTSATRSMCESGRVFCFIGNTANTGFSNYDNWNSPGPILADSGARPTMGRDLRAGAGWMQTYISNKSKYSDRLAKWLSFMSSNEGMKLAYYGFEGIDYNYNSGGLIEQTAVGQENASNYSTTGIFAYWPFHHISWHDSVTQAPTDVRTGPDGLVAWDVQTAWGKAEETYIYDNSPLQLPANYVDADSEYGNIEQQVDQYTASMISRIVTAKDKPTFEDLYTTMIQEIKDLGIEKLDSYIDKQVQKQMNDYGVRIKGIN